MLKRIVILAATVVACLAAAPVGTEPPTPREVAPGVWLIPGGIRPNRQPDGNTVIFAGPKGLVVMDTGRHPWHRQAILDFAKARRQPITAIINSHWHLDHVSGNPDLKRAFPKAKVYASGAIDGALTGFLKSSAADGRKYLTDSSLPPETLEDLRNDLATIDNGQALRPDVRVETSGVRVLGGLKLVLNLAPNAATDGDVWVYDAKSGVAAVGDIVTLPAPFLDTACPQGWKAALDQVWAAPFKIVIPGHGEPMTRQDFSLYRSAFSGLIDCAASTTDKADCAADWARAVTPLIGEDKTDQRRALGMAGYYVDLLRKNGGKSPTCRAA